VVSFFKPIRIGIFFLQTALGQIAQRCVKWLILPSTFATITHFGHLWAILPIAVLSTFICVHVHTYLMTAIK
jgi:hypothetical protein